MQNAFFPSWVWKKKKVEGKKCSSLEMLIARYCTVRRREYYRGARYSKRKSQVKKDSVVEFIWQWWWWWWWWWWKKMGQCFRQIAIIRQVEQVCDLVVCGKKPSYYELRVYPKGSIVLKWVFRYRYICIEKRVFFASCMKKERKEACQTPKGLSFFF